MLFDTAPLLPAWQAIAATILSDTRMQTIAELGGSGGAGSFICTTAVPAPAADSAVGSAEKKTGTPTRGHPNVLGGVSPLVVRHQGGGSPSQSPTKKAQVEELAVSSACSMSSGQLPHRSVSLDWGSSPGVGA